MFPISGITTTTAALQNIICSLKGISSRLQVAIARWLFGKFDQSPAFARCAGPNQIEEFVFCFVFLMQWHILKVLHLGLSVTGLFCIYSKTDQPVKLCSCQESPRAHLHAVGMMRFMILTLIHRLSLPIPFYSLLAPTSVFMALSTASHSMHSPNNSQLSHSVLPVLFLPYWSFQLYISL